KNYEKLYCGEKLDFQNGSKEVIEHFVSEISSALFSRLNMAEKEILESIQHLPEKVVFGGASGPGRDIQGINKDDARNRGGGG
ncbi:unnamed protein product, partial [Amoebophrya sp. A25]